MSTAIAPDPATDTAIADAQAQVDALEAAKVTDPTAAVIPPDPAADPAETAEAKETRERDAAGRFKAVIDYSTVVLPKDATDTALLERTVTIAREQGLSPQQAQSTVDLVAQEVAASKAQLLQDYQPGGAAWTKQLDAWKAETLADPALGKTTEERTAAVARGAGVLRKYATENPTDAAGMNDFLDKSGLGEHPMAVRFFNWLGKVAGERPVVLANSQEVQHESAIERKYIESGMNP